MPRPPQVPRPKGLWKARESASNHNHNNHQPDDHEPRKRQRTADLESPDDLLSSSSTSSEPGEDDFCCADVHLSSASSCSSSSATAAVGAEPSKEILYWDYSRRCSPHPERLDKWTTRTKLMDTSSTVNPPSTATAAPRHVSVGISTADAGHSIPHPPSSRPSQLSQQPPSSSTPTSASTTPGQTQPQLPAASSACLDASEDWEDLKELFTKAAEMYYDPHTPATETIPLLRGVIHECHRIMREFPDPTVLFVHPAMIAAVAGGTGSLGGGAGQHHHHHHHHQQQQQQQQSWPRDGTTEKRCKCLDLPTAFHTLLGTTLFLFGNLIGQDPSLALTGEPDSPMPYWLIALDVFELGENLPVRTSGRVCPSSAPPEDWRMAVVWGRTLVCVADEILSRHKEAMEGRVGGDGGAAIVIDEVEDEDGEDGDEDMESRSDAHPPAYHTGQDEEEEEEDPLTLESVLRPSDDPSWPEQSPFAMIKSSKEAQLIGGWNSIASMTPHDLMLLAQDQFARGIFHMPHPQHMHRGRISLVSQSASAGSPQAVTSGHGTSRSASPSITPTSAPGASGSSSSSNPPPPPQPQPQPQPTIVGTFSRSKELYTIASEVLLLSEKLSLPSHRIQWASWADSVLSQMKMELSSSSDYLTAWDSWKGVLAGARGRAWLVVGSGKAEGVEAELEKGRMGVLGEEKAKEAREALKSAVEYLDVAVEEMGSLVVESGEKTESGSGDAAASTSTDASAQQQQQQQQQKVESDLEDLNGLLAEALLTLANLTEDKGEREELYARAQKVGGDRFVLDEDEMMDESG